MRRNIYVYASMTTTDVNTLFVYYGEIRRKKTARDDKTRIESYSYGPLSIIPLCVCMYTACSRQVDMSIIVLYIYYQVMSLLREVYPVLSIASTHSIFSWCLM